MRAPLLFIPYLGIPLLVSLIFKKKDFSMKKMTYVFTGLIVFIYPFIVLKLDEYLSPPPPEPRCGLPEAAVVFCSTLFLLPISLILQHVFNKIFKI